jgi:hypothetical protein
MPTERPPLLGKVVPTFADRGCCVVSATNPPGRIHGFLDWSRYYFFQVAPQLYSRVLTRLSGPRSRPTVINTEDAEETKQRHYPLSSVLQKDIRKDVDSMLASGVTEPSSSLWSSPSVSKGRERGIRSLCKFPEVWLSLDGKHAPYWMYLK